MGVKEMTNHWQTRFRAFLASLALTAGVAVGAVIPIGPAAQSQELQWATQANGTIIAEGRGIATTARGDSYVTGTFFGTVTFGQGEPNETKPSTGWPMLLAAAAKPGAGHWSRLLQPARRREGCSREASGAR
jgi:hypothetical protein